MLLDAQNFLISSVLAATQNNRLTYRMDIVVDLNLGAFARITEHQFEVQKTSKTGVQIRCSVRCRLVLIRKERKLNLQISNFNSHRHTALVSFEQQSLFADLNQPNCLATNLRAQIYKMRLVVHGLAVEDVQIRHIAALSFRIVELERFKAYLQLILAQRVHRPDALFQVALSIVEVWIERTRREKRLEAVEAVGVIQYRYRFGNRNPRFPKPTW